MKPPIQSRAELNVPCRYLRKRLKPRGVDDWGVSVDGEYEVIGHGVLKLTAKTGADLEFADGLENVTTYEAVDSWLSGILTTDMVELSADGRRFHIRRRVNWNERNKWAVMTLVYRELALAGVDDV